MMLMAPPARDDEVVDDEGAPPPPLLVEVAAANAAEEEDSAVSIERQRRLSEIHIYAQSFREALYLLQENRGRSPKWSLRLTISASDDAVRRTSINTTHRTEAGCGPPNGRSQRDGPRPERPAGLPPIRRAARTDRRASKGRLRVRLSGRHHVRRRRRGLAVPPRVAVPPYAGVDPDFPLLRFRGARAALRGGVRIAPLSRRAIAAVPFAAAAARA
jgi:hypothetical protein